MDPAQGLHLNGIGESETQAGFGSVSDLFALGGQDDTRAAASTDERADSGSFSATGNCADDSAPAEALCRVIGNAPSHEERTKVGVAEAEIANTPSISRDRY